MRSHVHSWKDAPDWLVEPGLHAQECTPCRGLRFVPDAIPVVHIPNGANPEFVAGFRLGWNTAVRRDAPPHRHDWAIGRDEATGKDVMSCMVYGCRAQGDYVTECPTCHSEIAVTEQERR